MITVNTERLYMLDMRGKKKKTTWEKNAAGDWLPRSPLGATKHCYQIGFKVTQQGRSHQRKVYANEALLKKALLSMLPKHLQSLEMSLSKCNLIYNELDGFRASFRQEGRLLGCVMLTKRDDGYRLYFGTDTIRSVAREILNNQQTPN